MHCPSLPRIANETSQTTKKNIFKERAMHRAPGTCMYNLCIFLYKLMSQHKQNKLLNSRNIVDNVHTMYSRGGSRIVRWRVLLLDHAHFYRKAMPTFLTCSLCMPSSTCKLNSYMCELCSRCISAPVLRQ